MTDQAYSESATSFATSMLARVRDPKPRAIDKVVSLPPRSGDGATTTQDERAPHTPLADFSSAFELIQEASEAIRISEERADDLEVQLGRLAEQAAEEVRRLDAELTASERRLARSEERVRAAEARAIEAENWLTRLHEAVLVAFTPLQHRRATSGQAPGRTYEAPQD